MTTTFVASSNWTSPPMNASQPNPIDSRVSALTSSFPAFRITTSSTPPSLTPIPSEAVSTARNRGAWYAAFDPSTSQAEVAWHKWVELVEVDWTEESVTYDDYLADFGGEFHDARGDPTFQKCLDPDSYVESQLLAEPLLRQGSPGIIYPSVRRKGGICLACFRPALVSNVRKTARYRFTWTGAPTPAINPEETYM